MAREKYHIAIIGAGLSGLGMAASLKSAGFQHFTIYEAADELGGTWRDTTYPNARCDIPAQLYHYSFFAGKGERGYATSKQLHFYCHELANHFGITNHIRYGAKIKHMKRQGTKWHLSLETGEQIKADLVIAATGALAVPRFTINHEAFTNPQFHSSQWQDIPLTGKKIGLIGTGASGIQMASHLAKKAEKLYIFQRTPPWIIKRPSGKRSRFITFLQAELTLAPLLWGFKLWQWCWQRKAKTYLHSTIKDEALRQKLTPNYPIGCKRIIFSDSFLPMLTQNHVKLITTPITKLAGKTLYTKQNNYDLDIIIHATGFQKLHLAERIEIINEQGEKLEGKKLACYQGVAHAGFANFFLLLGPNSGLGHSSVLLMVEAQINYIRQCVEKAISENCTLAPKPEAQTRFLEKLGKAAEKTIWVGNCHSWYINSKGKLTALWPRSIWRYQWMMRRIKWQDYERHPNNDGKKKKH